MISFQNQSHLRSHLPFFPDRKELFHRKNGARKSAKKILIVITDGQKYKDPLEYRDVIPQAEKAGIIRYAIGVGPPPHGFPRLSQTQLAPHPGGKAGRVLLVSCLSVVGGRCFPGTHCQAGAGHHWLSALTGPCVQGGQLCSTWQHPEAAAGEDLCS